MTPMIFEELEPDSNCRAYQDYRVRRGRKHGREGEYEQYLAQHRSVFCAALSCCRDCSQSTMESESE